MDLVVTMLSKVRGRERRGCVFSLEEGEVVREGKDGKRNKWLG